MKKCEVREAIQKGIGQKIGDKSWYKLMADKEELGITRNQYPTFIKWVVESNRGMGKSRLRIEIFKELGLEQWAKWLKDFNLIKSKHLSTYIFILTTSKSGMFYPKDVDIRRNGKYNLSPYWYRWFNEAGLSLTRGETYTAYQYAPVYFKYLRWVKKKTEAYNEANKDTVIYKAIPFQTKSVMGEDYSDELIEEIK